MMHEKLWEKITTLDPEKTAKRTKCKYLTDSATYTLVLLGQEYLVDINKKQIVTPGQKAKPDFLQSLCILTYIINAVNIPLSEKIVTANKLEAGQFFFRGPHALPVDKLEKAFGSNPAMLLKAGENLSAEKCDYGDASIKVLVLPRLPVYFVIWAGDEEFPPRASILLDQTAARQLPYDALWTAVNLTTKALINH